MAIAFDGLLFLTIGFALHLKSIAAIGQGRPFCKPTPQIHNAMDMQNQITTTERLNEIAQILVSGLMRARARQSSALSPHVGDSSLDCLGQQSGHADVLTPDGGLV
jgi:hypothetical protein